MNQDDAALKNFRSVLLRWWRENARDYPWRHKPSAYSIAVAELMLRRTRADQVVAVYEAFVRTYPDLEAAAGAAPIEVKRLLYPLGLEWRADSIVEFLRAAHARFGKDLPANVEQLRSLPGIGDYVGSAIMCFAYGQTEALIDTNVVRVLGRLFGLRTEGEARRREDIRQLAHRAVCRKDAASYNYALLDFAAKVCVSRSPRCCECPFARENQCKYALAGTKSATI